MQANLIRWWEFKIQSNLLTTGEKDDDDEPARHRLLSGYFPGYFFPGLLFARVSFIPDINLFRNECFK